jgi:intein/homing endonuclease
MSPGLTRLSKQIHIDNFGEISDATALHRPGPIHCLGLTCPITLKNEIVELKDIIDKSFRIPILDNHKEQIILKAGRAFKTGKQKVYRVKTESGKEIICTDKERFRVERNIYKKLKDLSLGDEVYYI